MSNKQEYLPFLPILERNKGISEEKAEVNSVIPMS